MSFVISASFRSNNCLHTIRHTSHIGVAVVEGNFATFRIQQYSPSYITCTLQIQKLCTSEWMPLATSLLSPNCSKIYQGNCSIWKMYACLSQNMDRYFCGWESHSRGYHIENIPFLDYRKYHTKCPHLLKYSVWVSNGSSGSGTPLVPSLFDIWNTLVHYIGILVHSANLENQQWYFSVLWWSQSTW